MIVKPNKHSNRIVGMDDLGRLIIELKAKPIDNEANIALIKFLKQEGLNVRIVSGFCRREKRLRLI